jgi:hypothetical protein
VAADVLRNVDPANLPFMTWAFITAFSVVGWAIAELDKLVDIVFPEGITARQRFAASLKFGQGFLASGFAGVGTYFVAKVSPAWIGMQGDVPEMIILLMVTTAAFGGTRFINAVMARAGFAKATP